jgi:hypothetical protein
MSQLNTVDCPGCRQPLPQRGEVKIRRAECFEDCARRCDPCGIGASNAAGPKAITFIYRDPFMNIPQDCRTGAKQILAQAFNRRSRPSKLRRFGFSTSEDAVTWVVFSWLLQSNRLVTALRHADLVRVVTETDAPALLLWGVPVGNERRGAQIFWVKQDRRVEKIGGASY